MNKFPGFPKDPATNYWPYPRALNGWWHILTGSEQKCLDYILRHTWGFKKNADFISYSQFISGVKNCDKGCGIKGRATLSRALSGLEKKGFVQRDRFQHQAVRYTLAFTKASSDMELSHKASSKTKLASTEMEPASSKMEHTIKDISIKDTSIRKKNIIKRTNNTVMKHKKYSSLKDITEQDTTEIAEKYRVPLVFVKLQLEALRNYCEAKGRRYKNYKAALRNFVINEGKRQIERSQNDKYRPVDARHIK